jgi:hypothetical protein
MNRTPRDLLDDAASLHVPDDVNLLPRVSARLERRTFLQVLRARPALAVLAALVCLGVLSGAAYAVGRSLGYIPGIGLVEPGTGLRVLPEPVVVERDGITLTVTQGLISAERTVLSYRVENIPESALARDFSEGETPPPVCAPSDRLQLPDGMSLSPTGGGGGGWQVGYEFRDAFDPLPGDVNEATLLVSCLLDTAPGRAPENWVIPLAFVPAPADMTIIPVMEVTPSPAATLQGGAEIAATSAPSPISIERTIQLEDGIILIGSFHSITTSGGLVASPYVWSVRMTDASGKDVPYDSASDIDLPAGDEHTSYWAFKILGRDHAWPMTISIDTLEGTLPDAQASFDFDTGPSPRPGQEWTINQDLSVGGYRLHVLTATRTHDGYDFSFQGDPAIAGVGIDIQGASPYVAPGGGGGGGGGGGSLSAGLSYSGAVPEGDLTVLLRDVTVLVPGPWSIQWEPAGAEGQLPPTATPGAAACVTDGSWAQARASVSPSIPADLRGQFFLVGMNAEGSATDIGTLGLADGERTFLAEGAWPVASPDGATVAFTGKEGLVLYDLASGQSRMLPGTDPSAYRMVWSPDSQRLAFIRSSPDEIMAMQADGTGLRSVRDNSAVYHLLVGWADSGHLLVTEPGPQGETIQSVDLSDGTTRDLFTISSNKADTAVSQDGQWIAFTTSLGGMQGNGLYVSGLDGSEPRLVAALEGLALYFPVWSPDSRWLILSLPDPNDPVDGMRQTLVELDTCRLTRLPELGGDVYSWGRVPSAR